MGTIPQRTINGRVYDAGVATFVCIAGPNYELDDPWPPAVYRSQQGEFFIQNESYDDTRRSIQLITEESARDLIMRFAPNRWGQLFGS